MSERNQYFEADLAKVASMQEGSAVYLNWSEESGGVVHLLESCWYFLFYVPLYGGSAVFSKMYQKHELEELVEEVHSWT